MEKTESRKLAAIAAAALEEKKNAPIKLGSSEKETLGKLNAVLQNIDEIEKNAQ